MVYFLANYRPYLSHFLENVIFAIPTQSLSIYVSLCLIKQTCFDKSFLEFNNHIPIPASFSGSNAWDFRHAMIAWFSKTSQRLRRIFDNFRSLLNFTDNSRRCSNDLWALKDTITSACLNFVRTQSHHSKPFWNIFVEIELNFRY